MGQKNKNKKENDDDDDDESTNEWKALHNEIMDAMGKLFVSDDRTLSERQKRLKVHLTQRDIKEYKITHQAMKCAAKLGNKQLIQRRKTEIRTLDDEEANDDEADDEYSDDEDEEDGTLRPNKRRRINQNLFTIQQQPQQSNDNNQSNDDVNPPVVNQRSLVRSNFVDESMDRENLPYLVADVHRDHN